MEVWRAEDAHRGRRGCSKCSHGGPVNQWSQIRIALVRSRIWIRIRIKVKSRIRICIKVKIRELLRLKIELWRAVDAHIGDVEIQMEPWSVCRPVVADSHHFDEEQDLDPDPH
jgi:hypothetical protein